MKKIIAWVAVVTVVVFLCLNSFTIIKPTQRGIMVTLGKAGDAVLESGLHIKAPFFQHIKKYSISPSDLKVSFGIGDDGCVTYDMQTVGLDAIVFWVYDETRLVDAVKKYDSSAINNMIRSAMLASVKEVIGHYTAQELIEDQSQVSTEVKNAMVSKMEDSPVNISMIAISNYNWSADYDRMINETMVKKQQVKQAEQEVQITELNAQKQVKEAEAAKQAAIVEAEAQKQQIEIAAEANLIKAQKEAEAKRVEADALAYYYAQLSKNLDVQTTVTKLEIEAERAGRWNGNEIPTYVPITAAGAIVDLTK